MEFRYYFFEHKKAWFNLFPGATITYRYQLLHSFKLPSKIMPLLVASLCRSSVALKVVAVLHSSPPQHFMQSVNCFGLLSSFVFAAQFIALWL